MKIAIISPGKLPIPAVLGGAIETLTTHLINENERQNSLFNFTIYNQTIINEEVSDKYKNCEIVYINGDAFFAFIYELFWRILRKISSGRICAYSFFIRECIKSIKTERFDCILVEGNCNQILQIRRFTKCKVVFHLHTDILNIDTILNKKITAACDKIIVISEFLRNRIVEIDGKNKSKTYVLKNAIDINKFDRNLHLDFRKQFREAHGLNKGDVLIMYCGRLSKEKGVKELLLAFENITNLNCKLLIIGSSWFSSNTKNEYVCELEAIASKLKGRILFTGYITQDDLPQYYASADISVCPSICNEAAGLVIIEALASSIPVVTSNKGGIPEYASRESCEIVECDEHFVEHLSETLERIIIDETHYLKKQKQARQSVLEYNIENYYESFKKIIFEVK